MSTKQYKVLLLDAANTIIHKPNLWVNYLKVLHSNGYGVSEKDLREKHRLISEVVLFPDRTDADFYCNFNRDVLFSLGIMPNDKILEDLFKACTYLPWEAFDDIEILKKLNIKKAILSNFKSSLQKELTELCGGIFETIIASESIGLRKPDIAFYREALRILEVSASEVLYIGDSLKLDIFPGRSIGIDSWLIDRDKHYPRFNFRLDSLKEIADLIQ